MQRTARQAAQDGTHSLKWQILLTLGVSLLLIMLLVSLATLFILWPGYQVIEEGEADNHLLRLHNAILDAQHSLASTAGDWSNWDDTYQFVAGQNPGYIDANMQPSGMHNNQLASISLFDQRGQLLWSGSLAPDGASLQDTSPLLLQRLQRLQQPDQPATGLVSDGQDIFLFARQDVRDSNLSLPANGTLLMTRHLDTLRLGTQLNLPALQQQLLPGAQPASRQSQILDPLQRRNQISLPLAGSPHSLQLTFDSPRHITRLATASLQTGGQLTLLGIFGCLLVAWWQLQRRISRPLACMARAITSLASHPGQLQQLEPLASRGDEIGTVAREICQMHQRILSLSSLDPLTGLPNRRQFDQRLEEHLRPTTRPKSFSLCFIDLDRFKPVNDQFGHKTGDHLLQELAQRMSRHLRSQDTLARIGGDEFVLILDQVHEETRIRPILQRLLDDIRQIQEIDGHPVSIDASIGVASYPRDAHDLHELLQQADMAMYRSKQQGGGGICLASELSGAPADYQSPQLHTYGRTLDDDEPPPPA